MVGVRDDVSVLAEHIEDGEAVRGERADPAGRLMPVRRTLALEPPVAVSQRGRPHADEARRHRIVRALRSIRVHGHLTSGTVDDIWRRSTLDAPEVEVGLVVNPPRPVRDQVPADVVVERGARIDMQDRWERAPVVGEFFRVHRERSFLQGPVGPHRAIMVNGAVAAGDRDLLRQAEHGP